MRASLLQIDVNPEESVNSRRRRVGSLVREQRGSDLVVLPELWTVGAFAYELFADEAEALDGPTAREMSEAARDAGVWLHAGSVPERGDDGVLYNTSLVFSPDGELGAHLPEDPPFRLRQGRGGTDGCGRATWSPPPCRTSLWASPPATTCASPNCSAACVDAGADAFVIPAGWPERRRAHWTLLARARAVENQAYVLACGTGGTHAGVEQAGHSIVVDPWGEVLAEAGPGEEILTVDLDPAKVAETREVFPALKDRVLGLDAPKR